MTPSHLTPFYIGTLEISTPLTLAPMAGHTHYAFRKLVREQGECGLVCTEFLSSSALVDKATRKHSIKRFDWQADEAPIAVQLFGSDPQVLAEAARIIADNGASLIDINMGCWVPKLAKKGAGAALLRDVCTATSVVQAVCAAVSVPVTVKIRTGFEDGVVTAIPFARAAADCGVRAIAVHARFAGQGHSGSADWDIIRQVKAVVPHLPVMGNGDVVDGASAARMFAETGCDAVMVGRGALGRPWIFAHIAHYLRTGQVLPPPPRAERARLALRLAELLFEHSWMREGNIVLELRGQLSKFALDEDGSVHIRNRLVRATSRAEIQDILQPLLHADALRA